VIERLNVGEVSMSNDGYNKNPNVGMGVYKSDLSFSYWLAPPSVKGGIIINMNFSFYLLKAKSFKGGYKR